MRSHLIPSARHPGSCVHLDGLLRMCFVCVCVCVFVCLCVWVSVYVCVFCMCVYAFRIMSVDPSHAQSADQKEPWYGAEFSRRKFTPSELEVCASPIFPCLLRRRIYVFTLPLGFLLPCTALAETCSSFLQRNSPPTPK